MSKHPICPYCNEVSELVNGSIIYPHRPDLFDKLFYLCTPCNAYVGCHPNSKKLLGRLADKELRKYKFMAHKAFDPVWKSKALKRKDAYKALAAEMNMLPKECHIGMFNVAQCKQVIAICLSGKLNKGDIN